MRATPPIRIRAALTAVPLMSVIFVQGCRSPFEGDRADDELRRTLTAAIDREIRGFPDAETRLKTVQPPAAIDEELAERRDELDAMTPALGPRPRTHELGADLTGREQREIGLNLQAAISSAVRNNLGVQEARLQPAINEAEVLSAEAAFDAVFFTDVELAWTDEPSTVPVLGGVPLGSGVNASQRYSFSTGIRKPLVTGGSFSVSTDLNRSRNRSPGVDQFPDPAYLSGVTLGFTQPLLRGFGSDVNRASIRLSRNMERRAVHELRAELLTVVQETEEAYWNLVFAWRDLEIRQWLVEQGESVRDVLDRRRDFDARLAEYADAVATVEQRKADVIRARREVRAASDRLKTLINDPELNVGSEIVVQPVDESAATPIAYSLREAIVTAVANRPEIQQTILNIDDASIRQMLAENARLPALNLNAQIRYSGLDDSFGDSYDDLFEGRFINYLLGLGFEMPIGNRAAESDFRAARLRRSASLIGYQQTVQNIIVDVKAALRDVVTNYELIQATRSFRVAQAENLRALEVREPLVGLTPEFLNLKFTRQNTLATARQQEILARVNFDQAVARLYRAMGIGLAMNQIEFDFAGDEAVRRSASNADAE